MPQDDEGEYRRVTTADMGDHVDYYDPRLVPSRGRYDELAKRAPWYVRLPWRLYGAFVDVISKL